MLGASRDGEQMKNAVVNLINADVGRCQDTLVRIHEINAFPEACDTTNCTGGRSRRVFVDECILQPNNFRLARKCYKRARFFPRQ